MCSSDLFAAFPNPATQELNVNYANHLPSDISVQFVNDLGQIVKTVALGNHTPGKYSENIDVSDLAAGNYYYSIITNTERIFSRVTIAR